MSVVLKFELELELTPDVWLELSPQWGSTLREV
jgi:hypothetical protein